MTGNHNENPLEPEEVEEDPEETSSGPEETSSVPEPPVAGADLSTDSTPRDLRTRLISRFPSMEGALKDLDGRVMLIMTLTAVLLLVFRKFGGSSTFEIRLRPEVLKGHAYLSVIGDYYWFLSCFFLLGVVPLLFSLPRSLRPARLGLGLGDWRFGLKGVLLLYLLMVSVVVAVTAGLFDFIIPGLGKEFTSYYPLNDLLGRQAVSFFSGKGSVPEAFLYYFIAYEILYGVYFIGWEYIFRGYLTFGLYERLGINGIFVANIPFALMHVGKPFPEALGSVIAGIVLGIFALRARSFWYCWILHAGIAWSMDLCAIVARIR